MTIRKILAILGLLILLVAAFLAWKFVGPAAGQPEGKYLYVRTGSTYTDVTHELVEKQILKNSTWFNMASKMIGYTVVRPGKYEISKGMSVINLVRMLRNGKQTPVDLVITKLRTRQALASRVGRLYECDSAQMLAFLENQDSLAGFGLDTNTAMAVVMPLTYTLKWNSTPGQIFRQFDQAFRIFWTDQRKSRATEHGLTPMGAITLASIVDEETNAASDKPLIASTYLNRIEKGMPLQADPTVKFAMKNFGLRRVLNVHLLTPSPFNTYLNKGLPPGPICTPAASTIDSVLNAPSTDYIYFVANSAFNGTHLFTTNYADHLKLAHLFQQELNKRNIK